jgi:hypothetical protein
MLGLGLKRMVGCQVSNFFMFGHPFTVCFLGTAASQEPSMESKVQTEDDKWSTPVLRRECGNYSCGPVPWGTEIIIHPFPTLALHFEIKG